MENICCFMENILKSFIFFYRNKVIFYMIEKRKTRLKIDKKILGNYWNLLTPIAGNDVENESLISLCNFTILKSQDMFFMCTLFKYLKGYFM